MTKNYSFHTAHDLLKKLERDMNVLQQEVTSDYFFNFVVTAYSLVDWVKNDPSIAHDVKKDLEQFRQKEHIKICRDLANSNKHFELDQVNQIRKIVDTANSEQGFGVGRFDRGGFGVGEEEITITLDDGSILDALDFAEATLKDWQQFLY